MKAHLTTAAYVAAYLAVPVALVVGFTFAPWPTAAVCLVGAVVGVRWVLRIPQGPP